MSTDTVNYRNTEPHGTPVFTIGIPNSVTIQLLTPESENCGYQLRFDQSGKTLELPNIPNARNIFINLALELARTGKPETEITSIMQSKIEMINDAIALPANEDDVANTISRLRILLHSLTIETRTLQTGNNGQSQQFEAFKLLRFPKTLAERMKIPRRTTN